LTVVGDTLTNYTFTANSYSRAETPMGFPDAFFFTPTVVGYSGTPTVTTRFSIKNRIVYYIGYLDGTSNSTSKTVTLPIDAATLSNAEWGGTNISLMDNDAWVTAASKWWINNGDTKITFYKNMVSAAMTNSGRCLIRFIAFYEI
jgi:hypothetical protein